MSDPVTGDQTPETPREWSAGEPATITWEARRGCQFTVVEPAVEGITALCYNDDCWRFPEVGVYPTQQAAQRAVGRHNTDIHVERLPCPTCGHVR